MLPFEQGANAVADDPKLVTFKYFSPQLMFQKESHAIALFPGGSARMTGFEIMTLVQTGKSDPETDRVPSGPGLRLLESLELPSPSNC